MVKWARLLSLTMKDIIRAKLTHETKRKPACSQPESQRTAGQMAVCR
jgi:hypothetical protein